MSNEIDIAMEQQTKLDLVKYRDSGMATYTYFWKNEKGQLVSPFFDSEKEAQDWIVEKVNPPEST